MAKWVNQTKIVNVTWTMNDYYYVYDLQVECTGQMLVVRRSKTMWMMMIVQFHGRNSTC